MNNSIYIKDESTFRNCISNIRKYGNELVDSLEKSNNVFTSVTSDDVWSSKSSSELKGKNEELKKQREVVKNSFDTYVAFLENTLNAYKTADSYVELSADKLSN